MRLVISSKMPIVRVVLLLAAAFFGMVCVGIGQETAFKGRLPAYYGEIVTESQRQEIYGLQEKYEKQISALEDQLETLKKKRDVEIEKVLNADQRAKLKKAKEEGAAKRKKTAEKKAIEAKNASK
jgi:HD-like signal output (HDOD) protein